MNLRALAMDASLSNDNLMKRGRVEGGEEGGGGGEQE